MKCLVTGAAGMLGSALVPVLKTAGNTVLATDLRPEQGISYLDVTKKNAFITAARLFQPDIIFHLAAETDLEACENDYSHALQTNTYGTMHAVAAATAAGAVLVYISTAGVFDGEQQVPYIEIDDPHPINIYGRTKLLGEFAVRDFRRHFVVRAGWMIGGGAKDKKFVRKIADQIRAGATVLHVVDDKFGTPTYAPDFARVLVSLCQTEHHGLYHCACTGTGTRLDVAREIVRFTGRDIQVVPVSSDWFKNDYPVLRPRSELLFNARLESLGMNTMRPWRIALDEYLCEYFDDIRGPIWVD